MLKHERYGSLLYKGHDSENVATPSRSRGYDATCQSLSHSLLPPPMHFLLLLLPFSVSALRVPFTLQDQTQHTLDNVKVPVELGVMSRCPDALLCENIFNHVLQKVSNKVQLSLRYIAKIDPSDLDFGVRCMHGPQECAGNVQQLCVAKYASPGSWWEFIRCQNYQGRGKVGQPEPALKCAIAAKIDWESSGASQCAGPDGSGKGAEGIRLLQEDVILSQKLGIRKSCTIIVNGEKVCVHDGTWKECENGHSVGDFVRQINNAYDRLNE
ncbi:hypothetical protein AX17_001309 [Amanita inopinata Kibby_2008]|nr:hypothetical protein AX17_001309 [Amanita inopinata Kibby_2008]